MKPSSLVDVDRSAHVRSISVGGRGSFFCTLVKDKQWHEISDVSICIVYLDPGACEHVTTTILNIYSRLKIIQEFEKL